MKKLKLVGILAAVVLIGGVISIPLINNHTAYKVEKELCETPLPEKTELIESISRAGKLTGNGNGMQYFGAILIRSDLSLEELDAYYSGYRSNEWEYLVRYPRRTRRLKWSIIVHCNLRKQIKSTGIITLCIRGESGNSLLKEIRYSWTLKRSKMNYEIYFQNQ